MMDTIIKANTANNEFKGGTTKLNKSLKGLIKKQAMNKANTANTTVLLHLFNGLQTVYNVQI